MIRETGATMQPPSQDHQLVSKRRVLRLEPQPRLGRRAINPDKVFGTRNPALLLAQADKVIE
jgi:hypothetical protein